MIPDIDT